MGECFMIIFNNLWITMKKRKISTYQLREKTGIDSKTIRRLKANENIAFTAMKGEDTLSCVAVSVQGKAKEIGPDRLPDLFRKNPYMEKIYPDVRSRAPSPYSKFTRGRANGLTFPSSQSNAPAFLLAGRRQRKQVTL